MFSLIGNQFNALDASTHVHWSPLGSTRVVEAFWRRRDTVPATLEDQEKAIIEAALVKSRGKVAGPRGAAATLGIPASTLESKIKHLGIEKRRFTTGP